MQAEEDGVAAQNDDDLVLRQRRLGETFDLRRGWIISRLRIDRLVEAGEIRVDIVRLGYRPAAQQQRKPITMPAKIQPGSTVAISARASVTHDEIQRHSTGTCPSAYTATLKTRHG